MSHTNGLPTNKHVDALLHDNDALTQMLGRVVDLARTTGGTAGRDEELCEALDAAEALLARTKRPTAEAA